MTSDSISWGNDVADREAKQASLQSPAQQIIVISNIKPLHLPEENTRLLQEGAQLQAGWLQKQGCSVLPQFQATLMLTDAHQAHQVGTKPLYHLLRPLMASLTRWAWVWASSESWWWTGKPGVLQSMGSQRVGHDWAVELNWRPLITYPNILSLLQSLTLALSAPQSYHRRP